LQIVKQSANDKVLIVAGGVTLDEALKAYEQLAKEGVSVAVVDIFSVKPIDRDTLVTQAKRVGGRVITVEDHYESGNFCVLKVSYLTFLGGIGEAVSGALADQADVRVHRLFVKELPRSGTPAGLLDLYGM
jgi:transketolase